MITSRRQRDVELVRALSHDAADHCVINWSEGSGGEVHRLHDILILFSVPQYGGYPTFEATFHIDDASQLVDLVYTWT